RGARAHVLHIANVHVSDTTQNGVSQVKWLPGARIQLRRDGYRGGRGIRDEAQPVAAVHFARLRGYIGRGEPEIKVRGQFLIAVFGDNASMPVGIEAINKDAIESGDLSDLARRDGVQLINGPGGREIAHESRDEGIDAREPDIAC